MRVDRGGVRGRGGRQEATHAFLLARSHETPGEDRANPTSTALVTPPSTTTAARTPALTPASSIWKQIGHADSAAPAHSQITLRRDHALGVKPPPSARGFGGPAVALAVRPKSRPTSARPHTRTPESAARRCRQTPSRAPARAAGPASLLPATARSLRRYAHEIRDEARDDVQARAGRSA